jgi:hypothetical protein
VFQRSKPLFDHAHVHSADLTFEEELLGADTMEIASEGQPVDTKLDGDGAGAKSECANALAEAERVLRELSLATSCTRGSSSGDEKSSGQSLVSAQSGEPRAALPSMDRIRLDPDLDFVVHHDGMIELTEAGFRRMVQAHSAGLDAVIGVDGREVLRLPAPKLGHDSCVTGNSQAMQRSSKCTDLIESHVRRTQPVAALLKAEESSEMALNMINKERERQEIESLLPWHAAGTLGLRDAERVERALAEDGELAHRYELVREELAETIRLNEGLGAPSARAMEKLFAAIDAEETRGTRTPPHRFSETPGPATGSP